ncbi:MAG TPA: acyltransferase family protein [Planctomycetaceae bacterium]|jgi:peptidoglycan/LPS O-acetylase OafA/YrhL
MSSTRTSYRPDIDGLRAIAVLAVVLCHARLGLTGGYIGVDVFFVISGYLITNLILKELEHGTFSLAGFWERRIRRILPALLAVTGATLIAGWFLLFPDAYASLGQSVVALTLLISNIHFWRGTGYFAAAADEMPLLHTWSLAVEEQFYLVVPVLLLGLARVRSLHRGGLLLLPAHFVVAHFVMTLVVVALVGSFGLSVYGTYRDPSATFYLLPSRAWELLVGGLLAYLPVAFATGHGASRSPLWKEFVAALGLGSILAPCLLYDQNTRFPGLAALPPVLGAALLIWSGRPTHRLPGINRLLAGRPVVFIGLISYSLYLWHWPVFALARYQNVRPLSLPESCLLVAACFLISSISWRYVELPFRGHAIFPSRRRLMLLAFSAVALLFGCGLAIDRGAGWEQRITPAARRWAAFNQIDFTYVHNLGPQDIPQNLVYFGNDRAAPQILIWGDSHAMAILPAIEALCQETCVTACAATSSSTAPALGYFLLDDAALRERAVQCNEKVVEFVRARRIRTVLLAAMWSTYFKTPGFPQALLNTIAALKAEGTTVYFLEDVPAFGFDVPRALARCALAGRDGSHLALPAGDYDRANPFHRDFVPVLRDRGVQILAPLPVLQARTGSLDVIPYDEGGSFYRDAHHLSPHGALALRPLLREIFPSAAANRLRLVSDEPRDSP